MIFTWEDYYNCNIDENLILDEEAKELTGIDCSLREFCDYWKMQNNLNENFWCKNIYLNNDLIGFIVFSKNEEKLLIMELIINKEKRHKGYGYKVLKELLDNSEKIIREKINYAEAVIFLKNIASQKCFEKAGFVKELHPDGDCYVYKYKK